jgi:hypothetical protein
MRTVYECPSCDAKLFPSFTLSPRNKIVAECSKCQHQDPSLTPADFSQGIAAVQGDGPGDASGVGWAGKRQVSVDVGRPVSTIPQMPAAAPTYASGSAVPHHYPSVTEPMDVISTIKVRRDWLEAEVARLEGYRLEMRKLDRMLAAARRVEAQHQAATMHIPRTAPEPN